MIKKAAAGYVGWLCANGIVAPEKNKLGGLNLAIGIFLIWGLQAPAPWCTSYYLGVIAASISMWAAQIKERMCVQ